VTREYYTTGEVSRMLKITKPSVSRLCKQLGIGFKASRDYILFPADIEALKNRKTTPGPIPKEEGHE